MKRTCGLSCCGFLVAIALAIPANATAAFVIYMSPDGIDGESQDKVHEDWIEVISIDLALDLPVDAGSLPGSGGSARSHLGPVTVRKNLDKSSPALAESLVTSSSIKHIWFNVTRPVNGTPDVFLSYSFGPAFITGIEWEVDFGTTEVVEVVTIHYLAYQVSYRQTSPGDGSLMPPITTGWNQETNSADPLPLLPPKMVAPEDVPITDAISINGPSGGAVVPAGTTFAREEDAVPIEE